MKLILDYWNRRWQSVIYNTNNGSGKVRWLSKKPPKCSGWVFRYSKKWYAVWNTGEHLVFQVRQKIIPIIKEYKCEIIINKGKNIFKLLNSNNDQLILQIFFRDINRKNDPTFDNTDKEQENFFFWLSHLWEDENWKKELIKNWLSYENESLRE